MLTILFLAAVSFTLSFFLTPVIRDIALSRGWVDLPDQERKKHIEPVPRVGGIPIMLAYGGAFGIVLFFSGAGSMNLQQAFPVAWKLLPATLLVFATGLLDDLIGLTPWQKLLGQTTAAILVCAAGIRIDGVAGHAVDPVIGSALTVVWLIGCANAFNLIDGLDGLASGLGLLAICTMTGAALLHGDKGMLLATAPLGGALLGFLLFNFNPASIFLGDCGSLFIGFMLGCYGVIWSQKSATALGITAPLMALAIPLLDTALSITRRFLRGQPIFSADHGHIHHRLLERGLTPRRVALLLYAAAGVGACFSLLQSTVSNGVGPVVIILFSASVWLGIQYLGYQEFCVAARLLRENSFRRMVRSQLSLQAYEHSLLAASSSDECWQYVQKAGREFGFVSVAMRLGGQSYQDDFEKDEQERWILHIPFSEAEFIQLSLEFNSATPPIAMAPLAAVLHKSLSIKAIEFSARPKRAAERAMSAGAGMSGGS